jgi:hypothetical protein
MNHEESFRKEMSELGYKEDVSLEKEMSLAVRRVVLPPALIAILSILMVFGRAIAGHIGDDVAMRIFALLFVLSLVGIFFCKSIAIKKFCATQNLSARRIAMGGSSTATAFVDSSKMRFALILYWML